MRPAVPGVKPKDAIPQAHLDAVAVRAREDVAAALPAPKAFGVNRRAGIRPDGAGRLQHRHRMSGCGGGIKILPGVVERD